MTDYVIEPAAEMLPASAMAIAVAHAARDRDTLARLAREGKVVRDASIGAGVPGAGGFRRDIAARAEPRNLAIRPKKKRR